ncbi:uncharacterized protein G2W53_003060 [Senna tora]|uniref:Uncharacterized protein n=1 Tax=Senna tora TaxID=362788 RepID=A0A834XA90_9FABA|nr:uncharacterized protein G2W53_003060 [Senna tora]
MGPGQKGECSDNNKKKLWKNSQDKSQWLANFLVTQTNPEWNEEVTA